MARFLPSVFLLVLVLMATVMGRQFAEGRLCHSQSHDFAGTCFRKVNCHAICQTEGFYGGKCVGFRRRCTCYKDC